MPKLNSLEKLALALVLLLGLISGWLYWQGQTASPGMSATLGGGFSLDSLQGPVALKDFRGQGVVLMFGYTSCPDVCPTGMANLAAAYSRLSESQQQQLQALFISVDPQRDTLEQLDQYSRYFHPRFRGITGSKAEIDPIVQAYGAFYQMVELPGSALGYSVDHSSRLYLIDRQGRVAGLVNHNAPVNELEQNLLTLIEDPA